MYYAFENSLTPPAQERLYRRYTCYGENNGYDHNLGATPWEALLGGLGPYLWTLRLRRDSSHYLVVRPLRSLDLIRPLADFLRHWLVSQGFSPLGYYDYLETLAGSPLLARPARALLSDSAELSLPVLIARVTVLAACDLTHRGWENPEFLLRWVSIFEDIMRPHLTDQEA
jgi:hypothetical protein